MGEIYLYKIVKTGNNTYWEDDGEVLRLLVGDDEAERLERSPVREARIVSFEV